jgi:hypothetical protein
MRADPEPDQYRAAQLVGGVSQFSQWGAVFGNPDSDCPALPGQLQLPRPRPFNRKIDRVGVVGFGGAELDRRRAVAFIRYVDDCLIVIFNFL